MQNYYITVFWLFNIIYSLFNFRYIRKFCDLKYTNFEKINYNLIYYNINIVYSSNMLCINL